MAQARKRLSRAEALRRRAGAQFVGRRAQLALFAENLRRNPDSEATDDPADFLFHVRGVGGVGKSTLIAEWREAARRAGALTAVVDENDVHGVESALSAIARQLADQAGPLKEFDRALDQHRRSLQAAADRAPAPPTGGETASLPARMITQAAFGAASMLPGAGVVAAVANPENVALGTDRLIAGLRQRRRGNDSEEEALSRAFVAELEKLCGARDNQWVVIFLDTWELTGRHLDAWLREFIDGAYGEVPLDVVIVLAGRDELSERDWGTLRSEVVDVPLDVFTEQETRELLAVRGVTDPEVVEAVLGLSMRLPLLVALLAQTGLQAVDDVADADADLTDHAVERFLQWIPEPDRRETVLAAALPLQLNHDLFACAVPGAAADAWDWLLDQPFVSGRGSYRQYHAVVRASMLRRQRMHSPTAWSAAHTRLAEHFTAAREALERRLPERKRRTDEQWRRATLNETYHLLCADPAANLAQALEHVARITGVARADLPAWLDMLRQAAQDGDHPELTRWAGKLRTAAAEEQPETAVLTVLCAPGLPPHVRAWALAERGDYHSMSDRTPEAIADLDRAIALMPGLPDARAYRSRAHVERGDEQAAMADLDAALALDPEYAWALCFRGVIHLDAGRPDEAMADVTAGLALDPDLNWALIVRGEAHREAGRLEEAVADFTTALETIPEAGWALSRRGEAHRQAGRLDAAIVDLTAAIELDGEDESALGSRGLAHHAAGRLEEAVADFTAVIELGATDGWALAQRGNSHRVAGRREEAMADLTAALEANPADDVALARRGELHRLAGRFEEALADVTAALELDPGYVWALGERGQLHQEAGRPEEALADFTAALELSPDYAWALVQRGELHCLAGRLEEAAADLTAALELDPAYVTALAQRGLVHRLAGRPEEALADLSAALQLDPANEWALAERGELHRLEGRPEEAVADLSAALALDPAYGWALARRGGAHRLAGRLEEALADLSAALQLDPASAWTLGERSLAHQQVGRLEEAVADLSAALAVDPGYGWALVRRGEFHRSAGRLEEALADLSAALELDPGYVSALLQRGDVHRRAGRFEEATADLTAVLELEPEHVWALVLRACTHQLAGREAEAVADASAALSRNSDDPEVGSFLVMIFLQAGRFQEAREALRRAAQPDPDDSDVLLDTAMLALLEGGREASLAAWNDYAAAAGAGKELEVAAAALLHGLVVGSAPPDALARAFLSVPQGRLVLVDVRAYVEALTRVEAPVGPRADAALRVLRAPDAP
ncbi:tetratricopeptide repeat protein [Streptomyces sp. 1331.2]|uniref:tetratricopeptide repeat protein n=1 Tax=Streptomyces sp. 1331.2 TaxID=1938835 RepID=UPI000BDA0217|nr:tetratricopeptide repeat protein [Streptomyces sp. 1331.2]SOB81694.1 Tetratricopeptide (TPR) repeat [Streptomyces sp. 1331.2]